jgi:endonuclease YncB( thermonuclease family)
MQQPTVSGKPQPARLRIRLSAPHLVIWKFFHFPQSGMAVRFEDLATPNRFWLRLFGSRGICVSVSALQPAVGKGCSNETWCREVMRTIPPRRRAAVLFCGLVIVAAAADPATAAGCGFEPQGEGRVSTIIDNRTFRLEDGREVRLAGIQTATAGSAALAELIAGRDVTLRGETDAPDRWGRQAAFVFAGGSNTTVQGTDTSVQGLLLARGEALVSADIADKGCAAELAATEAVARQSRRGTWADSSVIKNAEKPGDILSSVGQFAVVEGKVLSVRQAGATFYANFGRRWTRDFAVSISRRMVGSFEAAGINLRSLENRHVRVRGWVEQRGGPRIELFRVGQLEVVGEN